MAEKHAAISFLHFRSGQQDYAIDLSTVKEIIRMVEVKPLAELPSFVKGMINLRGEAVPVIDFMNRAGAGQISPNLKNRIILLRLGTLLAGLLVEEVREAITVDVSEVSSNIRSDVVIDAKYIRGAFIVNQTMIVWVDIEKLLSDKEYKELEKGLTHA